MKVAIVLGARPQFIKAAPLLRAFENRPNVETRIVHTGQHFDENMSDIFFRELGIPRPHHMLGIHSGSHGQMTGRMLEAIETCYLEDRVDQSVVFGDTNTTLAGALASAKLNIPCAHVEAGLRSWDRRMPEEVNRVLVDHCSTWLFCPTDQAKANLENEGLKEHVYLVGDIMYDAVRMFAPGRTESSGLLRDYGLLPGAFFLLTVHRAYNTEEPDALRSIMLACRRLEKAVLFPVHPRTRPLLESQVEIPPNVVVCDPLGYVDMLDAVANCRCVLTDSGGLQKEAYFLRVPCVTLRSETEWTETVDAGWNVVAGTDARRIVGAVHLIEQGQREPIDCYGDGRAAEKITSVLTGQSDFRQDRVCGPTNC
ncbi:MAG: UDP-N-acetylglucosamine 2-epimerase (non-hydrolyzing) [Planctomycetes bacterium]|nr:UDP-N-acetylglucosamine 2-epimerase (non-hydrolyzing) [Planctomycetota bacterium]